MYHVVLAITLICIATALLFGEQNVPLPSAGGWLVAGMLVRVSLVATLMLLTLIVLFVLVTQL